MPIDLPDRPGRLWLSLNDEPDRPGRCRRSANAFLDRPARLWRIAKCLQDRPAPLSPSARPRASRAGGGVDRFGPALRVQPVATTGARRALLQSLPSLDQQINGLWVESTYVQWKIPPFGRSFLVLMARRTACSAPLARPEPGKTSRSTQVGRLPLRSSPRRAHVRRFRSRFQRGERRCVVLHRVLREKERVAARPTCVLRDKVKGFDRAQGVVRRKDEASNEQEALSF